MEQIRTVTQCYIGVKKLYILFSPSIALFTKKNINERTVVLQQTCLLLLVNVH